MNGAQQMNRSDLDAHMLSTYMSLRWGLAALALAFPVTLWLVGLLQVERVDLQGSMSAYYWAAPNARWLRDLFVGFLFAIGCVLYAYKGFTEAENIALNVAGASAIGVALVPMDWDVCAGCESSLRGKMHYVCAVLLFICIGYVSWFQARKTLRFLPERLKQRRRWFERGYRLTAILMVAAPVAAAAIVLILGFHNLVTFWLEFGGIYGFAAYWILKSYEMSLSQAEERAIKNQLPDPPAA
jgi:hypothetical protein